MNVTEYVTLPFVGLGMTDVKILNYIEKELSNQLKHLIIDRHLDTLL